MKLPCSMKLNLCVCVKQIQISIINVRRLHHVRSWYFLSYFGIFYPTFTKLVFFILLWYFLSYFHSSHCSLYFFLVQNTNALGKCAAVTPAPAQGNTWCFVFSNTNKHVRTFIHQVFFILLWYFLSYFHSSHYSLYFFWCKIQMRL